MIPYVVLYGTKRKMGVFPSRVDLISPELLFIFYLAAFTEVSVPGKGWVAVLLKDFVLGRPCSFWQGR
jgi:hypothetical protein